MPAITTCEMYNDDGVLCDKPATVAVDSTDKVPSGWKGWFQFCALCADKSRRMHGTDGRVKFYPYEQCLPELDAHSGKYFPVG